MKKYLLIFLFLCLCIVFSGCKTSNTEELIEHVEIYINTNGKKLNTYLMNDKTLIR